MLNFTPVKPIGMEINKNKVNRRFAGCELKTSVATGDDETQ
jgi:hypothetical protein